MCACVRCYFKELHKVRAPAQTASNMASTSDRAVITLWVLAQSHRVSAEFVAHRWREHPAVAGVINYHLFRFIVPLSLHHKLKAEIDTMHKLLNEWHIDQYKLFNRLKSLEDSRTKHKKSTHGS